MLKKIHLSIFVIIILAFSAGLTCYPNYFNQGVDYVNLKFEILNFKLKLPNFPEKPFRLGLDLQGGVHLIYQADLSEIKEGDKGQVMEGLRDLIERRVNLFGVREPVIQVQGEKLIVELSGTIDPGEAVKEIGKTPFLEFKEQRDSTETQKILDKQKEIEGKSFEEIQKIEDWQLAFEDPFKATSLTGRYLKSAELSFDQLTSKPLVSLEFNEEGAKIFELLTEKNIGKPLAIYIDGIPISKPTVQEKISGGKAQISGQFTIDQAKELARNLSAGALPAPITLISQETVGPILGKISLEKSFRAGIFGFIAILFFMIIFYRIPGFLASLSLLIYIAFNLALYKSLPVTLTLAGIAGFLLSMGMVVDANILIFTRMREEAKQGKNFLISLEDGFRRAWPAIRDGNFSTILVGLVLFNLGMSFVKGFAFTLVLGNFIGLFTAIFITNNLLRIFSGLFQKWSWLW
jgi:protein-export membrane protein SecD